MIDEMPVHVYPLSMIFNRTEKLVIQRYVILILSYKTPFIFMMILAVTCMDQSANPLQHAANVLNNEHSQLQQKNHGRL